MKPMNKHVIKTFCVITTMMIFNSCEKVNTRPANANPQQAMRDTGNKLSEEQITDFYGRMRNLKGVKDDGSNTNTMTLSDAELLTEASYNYYVARVSRNQPVSQTAFTVSEPMVNATDISEIAVADAFWQIKAQLLTLENSISYNGKALETFDLSITSVNGSAMFNVYATLTNGAGTTPPLTGGNGSDFVFNAAANHAWAAGSWGQCDINIISGQAQNINSTVESSPQALKAAAWANIYPTGCPSCIIPDPNLYLYINFETKFINGGGFGTTIPTNGVSTLPAPYDALTNFTSNINGILYRGVVFEDVYSVNFFFDAPSLTATSVTPADDVYKNWLTTPLMNFYLGASVDYIHNNWPANKSFMGLDVSSNSSSAFPPVMQDQYNVPYVYSKNVMHKYSIKYAEYSGIALGTSVPLSTF